MSLLGTTFILRHERKKLKLEQIARLKFENRWEIAKELYKHISDMYWALRSLALPGNKESTTKEIEDARTKLLKFRVYKAHVRFLLDDGLVKLTDNLETNLLTMNSDLAGFAESLHSDSPQAADTAKFLLIYRAKHVQSLTEGDVKKSIESLEASLRQYTGNNED